MATKPQKEVWPYFFEYQEGLKNLDAKVAAYKGDKESEEFRQLHEAQRFAEVAYKSMSSLICSAETEGLSGPYGRIKVPLKRSFLGKVDEALLEKYGHPHTQYLVTKIRSLRKVKDHLGAA